MPFCSACGADLSAVKFCPRQGIPVEECEHAAGPGASGEPRSAPDAEPGPNPGAASRPAAASAATAGSDDNLMGTLAYITIIPAILFLILEPYKNRRFVRFHSFQCLFLAAAFFVLSVVNGILGFIPVVGFVTIFTAPLLMIACLVIWIVVMVKAYQGEEYRLPVIGDMAVKQV